MDVDIAIVEHGVKPESGLADLPSCEVSLKYHQLNTELVTTLKRKPTKIISTLEKHRHPILITQRGRPAAYLVDVETYEAMNNKLAVLERIGRGERAVEEGRTVSHGQAKVRMSRWLK